MEATYSENTQMKTVVYDDAIVRAFSIITVVWGVVALLAGVIVAAQLSFWQLNFGVEWLSFGRLRPLHTNAVIFAFGGCALFATSYYVVQRTCQTRLFSDGLAAFTFWGWQVVILAAAVTLPLGLKLFQSNMEVAWGLYSAGAVVVSIPVVVLFIFLSRWLISGLTLGSVKG